MVVHVSDAPFEGKTVAQASFTGQRADPVRPVSRDGVPLASQKFLGTSEFQKAYPRHAVSVHRVMQCGTVQCSAVQCGAVFGDGERWVEAGNGVACVLCEVGLGDA